MYDISKILGEMEFALNTNNFLRLTALEDLHKNEKGDPFKILIGTILSSRTRDENTTQALIRLFKKYKGVKEISKANLDDIKEEITGDRAPRSTRPTRPRPHRRPRRSAWRTGASPRPRSTTCSSPTWIVASGRWPTR
jgi:hypothetical protein